MCESFQVFSLFQSVCVLLDENVHEKLCKIRIAVLSEFNYTLPPSSLLRVFIKQDLALLGDMIRAIHLARAVERSQALTPLEIPQLVFLTLRGMSLWSDSYVLVVFGHFSLTSLCDHLLFLKLKIY